MLKSNVPVPEIVTSPPNVVVLLLSLSIKVPVIPVVVPTENEFVEFKVNVLETVKTVATEIVPLVPIVNGPETVNEEGKARSPVPLMVVPPAPVNVIPPVPVITRFSADHEMAVVAVIVLAVAEFGPMVRFGTLNVPAV